MADDRTCRFCNQNDDHPRHVSDVPEEGPAHHDCCAEHGCLVCKQVLADAPEDARHGEQLLDYKLTLTPEHDGAETDEAPKKTAARKTAAKKGGAG